MIVDADSMEHRLSRFEMQSLVATPWFWMLS